MQNGLTCVATALGALTGKGAEYFLRLQEDGQLNTEDPISWSEALQPLGMKLAYLPFDPRKLRFYMEELVKLDLLGSFKKISKKLQNIDRAVLAWGL